MKILYGDYMLASFPCICRPSTVPWTLWAGWLVVTSGLLRWAMCMNIILKGFSELNKVVVCFWYWRWERPGNGLGTRLRATHAMFVECRATNGMKCYPISIRLSYALCKHWACYYDVSEQKKTWLSEYTILRQLPLHVLLMLRVTSVANHADAAVLNKSP